MKKGNPTAGRTKRPQKMTKEELIATLLKKKQCNAKALGIVEGMLEGAVNPQWLLDSLQFITQSHYQDAIEERAILKTCGYPLCSNPLGNVPKQQFKISTQNNRVYDISERKNFCSNGCYRSSTFLKDQIMTSPLWLRDIEKVPVFKLLDGSSIRGGLGDEVDVGPTRITAQEASIGSSTSEEIEIPSQTINNINDPSKIGAEGPGEIEISTPKVSAEKNVLESAAELSQRVPINEEKEAPLSEIEVNIEENKFACNQNESFRTLPTVKDSAEPSMSASAMGPENSLSIQLSHIKSDCKNLTDFSSFTVSKEKVNALESVRKTETSSTPAVQDSNISSLQKEMVDNKEKVIKKSISDDKQMEKMPRENKAKVREQKRSSRHVKVLPVAAMSVSELVERRLTEWFTVDSLCFLYGEQKTRELLGKQDSDFEQNFKPLDSATWDPEKHDRFVNICKRLNLLDLEDKSYDEKVINEDKNVVKKPLPDFTKLKEEAEKMDLRVQAFYKGQLEIEPRKVSFAEDTKEAAEDVELPVIPLVHQHEQRALRRRLVLDALNRVLPDLLRTLGVHSTQVSSALRGLVGTFALTAGNVTFNPRQWTLVAVAVIKLLSVREVRLHHALCSEASQKYLTLIQMSYNLGPTYLDLLVDRLVSSAIVPPKPTEVS